MKILVVYYSLEGNTQFIAESIAECLHADMLRLKPKKEVKNNALKYLIGGKQASSKKKPELHSYDIVPSEYDLIIIGSPVWAFTMTPAVRSFIEQEKLQNKNIAIFHCNRGGPGKVLTHMEELLAGNTILGTKGFKEPIKEQDSQKITACSWAQELLEKMPTS